MTLELCIVTHGHVKMRRVYVGFLYFFVGLWGIRSAVIDEERLIDLILGAVIAYSAVMGCATDAKFLQNPIPRIAQFLMFFSWPVTGTAYIISTRRWTGLLWSLLVFITLLLTYTAAAAIALIVIG